MARIRTIKPGFFKNEDLAEVPMSARLLFIGLWCLSDKEGRLEDRPKRIKAELFPYDSIEIDQQLSRLQSAGFINRYEVGELKVIQIINFSKHQRITGTEATAESDLPECNGNTKETTRKQQGNTLDDWKGKEGKGDKERKGKEGGEPPDRFEKKLILENPFSDKFLEQWVIWKNYKKSEFKFLFKSIESEQAAINDLVNKSGGSEDTAVKIIHQSLANGWKGLFELKNEENGQSTPKNTNGHSKSKATSSGLNQVFNERYGQRAS
jgi:hypothetical protein